MTQYDKVIPPGSEGKILASVDISHLKGPINKYVDFKSNDPINPDQRITIKADVKVFVEVQPAEQVRFIGPKGQPASQELTLIPRQGVKLLNATGAENLVDLKLEPSGEQYKLKVGLKEGLAVGNYNSTITVGVEGPVKEVTIPVLAIVRGPLTVVPPVISFYVSTFPAEVEIAYTTDVHQAPDPTSQVTEKIEVGRKFTVLSQNADWYQVVTSETAEKLPNGRTIPSRKIGWLRKGAVKTSRESPLPGPQKVSLQNATGTLKVLHFSTDIQDIKVKAENQNPNTYEFTVTLVHANRSKKGNLKGAIKVRTDNAQQPELSIPVVITVG